MSKLFGLIRQHLIGSSAPSRNVAKERLSVMLVHQRNVQILSDVDMESLQKELTAVVRKYIKVSEGERPVNYTVKHDGGFDLLEIHFPIDSGAVDNRSPAHHHDHHISNHKDDGNMVMTTHA